jgi:hypothetical protein
MALYHVLPLLIVEDLMIQGSYDRFYSPRSLKKERRSFEKTEKTPFNN